MLSAYVQGVGVLGPGLTGWPCAAAVLRAETPYKRAPTVLPAPAVLPPTERRRAGRVIKLALAVGAEALAASHVDGQHLVSVFSSSGGDGDNCHEICEALADDERLISPTRFHNSVHNATCGYWSIAYGCTAASTALCAYDASFGAGLLEAFSQLAGGAAAVLLVSYDLDYPPPLRAQRPIADACGIALVLARSDAAASSASAPSRQRLNLRFTHAPATLMAHSELEALRCGIPAARGLPLLERLAATGSDTVVLDYLETLRLALEVTA